MTELNIHLITPEGVELHNTKIPSAYTVRRTVLEFVYHLHLSNELEYSLYSIDQKSTLDPDKTLADAGVANGDTLKLVSSDPVPGAGGRIRPPSDSTIKVLVRAPGRKTQEEALGLDQTISTLLSELVQKYQLEPSNTPADVTYRYNMKSKTLGRWRALEQTETLRSAGIQPLDRLDITQVPWRREG